MTAVTCPHCGHRSPSVPSGLNGGAICLALAGALIGVAAVLPWETVFGVGLNGFDVGTAGALSLSLGLIVGVSGLLQIRGRGIGPGTRAVALLGGLAAIGLAILGYVQIHKQTLDYGLVSTGSGVFVVAIGGGLAIAAALFGRGRSA